MLVVTAIVAGLSTGHLRGSAPQQVGTWGSLGTIADSRTGAAAVTLPDGRTLIAGGTTADGTPTNSVVVLDASSRTTSPAGTLLEARVGHTATLLKDGRVLVAGGFVNGVVSADVEIFDPAAGTSVLAGSLAQGRARHAAAAVADGMVLIAGGVSGDGTVLDQAEIVDPATGGSSPLGVRMTAPRAGASGTTLIDGRVLIAGGHNLSGDLNTAEIFDPWAGTFAATDTRLSIARSGHTAVLLPHNNGVLIAGGTSAEVPVTTADLFLPALFPDPYSYGMGAFAATADLAVPRAGAIGGGTAVDGLAFVAGGGTSEAEQYGFATIKTDKDDYAPGQPAIITGSGWEPGEVTLVFQEDPAVHPDYLLTLTADGNGNIFWDQWAPEEHDLNVRFYLMAKQATLQGERRAQMTFTDSRNWNLNFAGSGSGSVMMTASTGFISAPVSCGGTGANAASQTVTSTCSPNITTTDNGATITFTATALSGSTFAGWSAASNLSSSTCTGTQNPCSAVLGSSAALTVTFNLVAPATKLAFTNAPVAGAVNACFGPLTVESQNASSVATNVTSATTVNLSTNQTGAFYSDAACSTGITTRSIASGTSSTGNFYYKPTAVGSSTHTLTAADNAAVLTSATQAQTVTVATQAITITQNAPATAAYNSSFDVKATGGGSTSPIAFAPVGGSVCTVGTVTSAAGVFTAPVTMTSGTGTCQLTLNQAADANYSAAPQVLSATTSATKLTQTISVTTPAPPSAAFNGTFPVAATASSGLTVAITATGGCSIAAGTVTMTSGTTTCVVHYNQSGDANYDAATEVTSNTTATKAAQTITVTTAAPASAVFNSTFPVAATASSGLTVAITATGGCSVLGGTVTMTSGTTTCVVHYNQAGDGNYDAATEVTSNTTATKASQAALTLTGVPTDGDYLSTFTASATGGSGSGLVTYAVTAGTACTVNASSGAGSVTSGTGSCTVTATKAGDNDYNPVDSNPQTLTAHKIAQTALTAVATPNPVTYGNTSALSTTGGTTAGAVTFDAGVSTGCSVAGAVLSVTNASGTCAITATMAGDNNYNPVTSAALPVGLLKADQAALTVVATPNPVTYGNTSALSTTGGTTGGTVTFSAGVSTGCSVAGAVLSVTNASGTCNVTATMAGDNNYNPVTSAALPVGLLKADQAALTAVATPNPVTYGNTSALSTTGGTTGGAVTFSAGVSTGCSVAGAVLSVTNASGTCAITATMAGNDNYNPVTSAALPVGLLKADQAALTAVATPNPVTYGNTSALSTTGGTTGGAVTFSAGVSTGCSVAGAVLSVTNASGTCAITATMAGNDNYNPVTSAALPVGLLKANQAALTAVATPNPVTYGNTSALTTTGGTTGGAVTFNAGASTGCSVAGAVLSVTNASGTCNITATKAGDNNYNPVTSASLLVGLSKANQTITFTSTPPPSFPIGNTYVVSATGGGSLNSVTFSSLTPSACSVTGSTVQALAIGLCTVAADQTGNDNYNAGHNVQSFGVIYNFTGFFRPVDNLPQLNVAKAGSAIPVKFSLGGNYGLNIFAAGYPVSYVTSCTAETAGAIEETVNAGGSSLSYDPLTDQYIYVWKTEKSWANSCRMLVVRLADGTDRIAKFSFTR